ncbi:arylsulfatase [Shewanella sp. D64]|uniref:sulfatase family protein n=1 Tax=unclassified Shewanella TaxID=196818 RepID=UPI0022BA418E|nr:MULTISPECIES: arylsulfatase [unclassified Shewanella]MEC4726467.1 arylsulfatase [Shewanella sp. D64]MEC4738479.1 arylsulfatase [Shewanella sp. E94]WBJ94121.1 arylsulfatase [Shewanella sp. MTB7]
MCKQLVTIINIIFVIGLFTHTNVLASEVKPNIVILYADDMGSGDLTSFNQNSKIPTPNLDQLAAQGMSFTDAHSSSGICSPSRYALLTGRYHWRKFHSIVKSFGPSVFADERLTLPEMLQQKGYTTAAIGKWHLGWNWDAIRKDARPKNGVNLGVSHEDFDWSKAIPDGPLDHGFDYYFGDTVINFPPYVWIENDRVTEVPDTMVDARLWKNKEGKMEYRKGPMITGWDPYENIPMTTQKGIDYIKKQAKGDKPFFLYFAYPSPHAPIIPNDEFDNTSKAGPYGDLMVETDDSIGQLLTALNEAGIADNTLVIFSSDNGPENYAYLRDEKFDHWSSFPYRGLKRDIYEGGHRVPMIVRWPRKVLMNSNTDELVSQIDIMATLASLVGFELPNSAAEDSYDLLPLWTGQSKRSTRDSIIHNTYENSYAIRSHDWSLIAAKTGNHNGRLDRFNYADWQKRHGYRTDDNEKGQLFDIKNDRGQRHNVIEKHPEKAEELKTLLQKIRLQGYSRPTEHNIDASNFKKVTEKIR